jgi:hypothetical protein
MRISDLYLEFEKKKIHKDLPSGILFYDGIEYSLYKNYNNFITFVRFLTPKLSIWKKAEIRAVVECYKQHHQKTREFKFYIPNCGRLILWDTNTNSQIWRDLTPEIEEEIEKQPEDLDDYLYFFFNEKTEKWTKGYEKFLNKEKRKYEVDEINKLIEVEGIKWQHLPKIWAEDYGEYDPVIHAGFIRLLYEVRDFTRLLDNLKFFQRLIQSGLFEFLLIEEEMTYYLPVGNALKLIEYYLSPLKNLWLRKEVSFIEHLSKIFQPTQYIWSLWGMGELFELKGGKFLVPFFIKNPLP